MLPFMETFTHFILLVNRNQCPHTKGKLRFKQIVTTSVYQFFYPVRRPYCLQSCHIFLFQMPQIHLNSAHLISPFRKSMKFHPPYCLVCNKCLFNLTVNVTFPSICSSRLLFECRGRYSSDYSFALDFEPGARPHSIMFDVSTSIFSVCFHGLFVITFVTMFLYSIFVYNRGVSLMRISNDCALSVTFVEHFYPLKYICSKLSSTKTKEGHSELLVSNPEIVQTTVFSRSLVCALNLWLIS